MPGNHANLHSNHANWFAIFKIMMSCVSPGALSLASPGVPGNCRKQCSVPGKLPGDTMVVLVGQMVILSAHAWCGTSVKNTMEGTIMKRIIFVNHAIL